MPGLPFPLPGPLGGDLIASSRDTRATSPGRDLGIDYASETCELLLSGGDLQIYRDEAALQQNVDLALNLYLGEWYLDLEEGIPYFDRILVKSPDLAEVKSILSAAILKVEGIVAVVSLDLVHDRAARTLRVTWSAQYDLGVINGALSINV